MNHQHKVEDTRKRSVLKSLTGRTLEITIGSFVISFVFTADLAVSVGVALVNETICAVLCYFNDRLWNRLQWGRKVEDIDTSQKKSMTDEELLRLLDEIDDYQIIEEWEFEQI